MDREMRNVPLHVHCIILPIRPISLHEGPPFSYAPGSESRMRKLRLHYGDFVQANYNMADKTAGQLQSTLRVVRRFLNQELD